MAKPPGPGNDHGWVADARSDPARYLIDPGNIIGPGRGSPGNLAHRRPHLVSGSLIYVWPVGVEGFDVDGTATLSIHKYFGDNAVDGRTLHKEEGRITLTGTFPGLTSTQNMADLRSILMSTPPNKGMVLYAEGVFDHEQYILPENWRFTHDESDGTSSIAYTVTFVRIGIGKNLPDPKGTPPPPNPGAKQTPKGKPRTFSVRAGARTLRSIAKIVYGNADRWTRIADLNKNLVGSIPAHQIPTHMWPIGTKFRY